MTYTALPSLLKYLRSFNDLESVCVGEGSRAQLIAEIESALADAAKLAKVRELLTGRQGDLVSEIDAILGEDPEGL